MAPLRLDKSIGWPAFFWYVLSGGLLSFGIVAAASVGLLVLPFGMVLFGLLIAYAPDPRDRWGVFTGVGAVGILIGLLNIDNRPCAGWVSGQETGSTSSGATSSVSCGGLDGRPWLVIGVLLIVVSLVVYRRRRADVDGDGSGG